MIRYRLRCGSGHDFDGWFRSSGDCDDQIEAGIIACTTCGDTDVAKALMAPSVSTSRKKDARTAPSRPAGPDSGPKQPVAAMPPEMRQVVEAMRELRKKVTEHADYVGPKFAEEARRIHYGETPERGIYGEASADDVKGLKDDGIEVMPLPVLPEDRN